VPARGGRKPETGKERQESRDEKNEGAKSERARGRKRETRKKKTEGAREQRRDVLGVKMAQ